MSDNFLYKHNELNTATGNNAPFALAFYVRGNDWAERGELDRAIADYDAALRVTPRDGKAIRNRSLALEQKGNSGGDRTRINLRAVKRAPLPTRKDEGMEPKDSRQ